MSNHAENRVGNLLLEKGIFVKTQQGFSIKEALLECWKTDDCPLSPDSYSVNETTKNEDEIVNAAKDDIGRNESDERNVCINVNATDMAGERETSKIEPTNKIATDSDDPRKRSDFDKTGRGDISFGLQGLMKAYSGRPKYKGGWDENLVGTVEVHGLSALMCNFSDEEKCVGIKVMLDEGALSHCASNIRKNARSYCEVIQTSKDWLTSEEQRTIL